MLERLIIKKSSIQSKLILSYFLLIFIPLGLLGLVTLAISKSIIEEEVSNSNLKTLGQISQKLEMVMDDIISVTNIYYLNPDVTRILSTAVEKDSYAYREDQAGVEKLLTNFSYAFGWLKYYTSIVGVNGREYHSDYPSTRPGEGALERIGLEALKNEKWYTEVIEKNGKVVWVSGVSESLKPFVEEQNFISAVRVLKNFFNGERTGVLIISVNESSLQDLYKGALKEYENILITDENGKIISGINSSVMGKEILKNSQSGKIFSNFSGYFVDRVNGVEVLTTFHTVDKTGWKIIAYTPLDKLLKNIQNLQNIILTTMLACILLAFLTSYFIARRLSVPVRNLYKDMNRVESGDLAVRTRIYSKDEIGELAGKFNRMVEKIQGLMNHVIQEQQMKRKAELQSLQAQVNPHFLYNTLASIRFMLNTGSVDKVDEAIVALVKLLKKTLSRENELITVFEELENLKNYVLIQKVRQGDKLEVRYEVDEAVWSYLTPKLILQPLVENAIFHGIEPKKGRGTIVVKSFRQGEDILFDVADDGVGMERSKTEHVLSDGAARNKFELFNGIGIKNIHERLVLYFGEGYGLTVDSEPGMGTRVRIRIPAFLKEEELIRDENADRG